MRHVNIGDFVKEKRLYSERDEEYDCLVIDEDALCDELEPVMQEGHHCCFHGADLFPERWFDLVLVPRTDNTISDRLWGKSCKIMSPVKLCSAFSRRGTRMKQSTKCRVTLWMILRRMSSACRNG